MDYDLGKIEEILKASGYKSFGNNIITITGSEGKYDLAFINLNGGNNGSKEIKLNPDILKIRQGDFVYINNLIELVNIFNENEIPYKGISGLDKKMIKKVINERKETSIKKADDLTRKIDSVL